MGREATCVVRLNGKALRCKVHLDRATLRLCAQATGPASSTSTTPAWSPTSPRFWERRRRAHLAPAGALWLIHPKGKASPAGEAAVRGAIHAAGLVDVKVAAFSATHTAVKAVIPLAARARA